LVVLDEPTAHLDAVSRFGFLKLLETMRRETGKTFLVVMHELTDVLRCADRIVTLQEGRVVFSGTPEQCLADRIPETCLGIRVSGDRQHGFAALPVQND
jgi:iron complex transport system ATP-binding protein